MQLHPLDLFLTYTLKNCLPIYPNKNALAELVGKGVLIGIGIYNPFSLKIRFNHLRRANIIMAAKDRKAILT